jgi:transposase
MTTALLDRLTHNHAFRVLGGVPRRGIYDNMRTAVDVVKSRQQRSTGHMMSESEISL